MNRFGHIIFWRSHKMVSSSETDRIRAELKSTLQLWELREIPFSESASVLRPSHLREVFTGRMGELKKVLTLFLGRERKRILIYGWVGIGKTAFILQVMDILRQEDRDTLTAYISLPPEADLATAALIALAREMKKDEWAQHQLNQMGLRSKKPVHRRKSKIKVGIPGIGSELEEETISITPLQFPTLSFEDLLERAIKKYRRVVIAVDDLDKQDPARVRQLLHDAQGMLKSGAWVILTGHPSGITRDVLISERGLFDLALKLEELNQPTAYNMLVNYLNSARTNHAHYDPKDSRAVHPFTPETARALCERSGGVPRWLNRLGCYVLLKAAELQAEIITHDVLQQGFEYANQQLRGQPGLTPEDYYVLDLLLEKGILSDTTVTLEDIERVRAKEFSEILPILEKLVQLDLVRRLPTERAVEYEPTPMMLEKRETSEQKKASDED